MTKRTAQCTHQTQQERQLTDIANGWESRIEIVPTVQRKRERETSDIQLTSVVKL